MRAEATSWNDGADEQWHVQLAAGKVKVVSLQQLDDLFRLSLVDAETHVWQSGMPHWQPLRVIAGLEDHAVPEPPRAPAPAARRPLPPPPSSAPQRTASLPPALSNVVSLYPQPSVRPLVVSRPPTRASQRGGGFGRWLIGLSLLAGLGITLYRNGVLRDAARSLHRDALYARFEAKLGGPAFGTLRALEQELSTANAGTRTTSSLDPAPASAALEAVKPSAALAAPRPSAPLEAAKPSAALEAAKPSVDAPHAGAAREASAEAPVVRLEALKQEPAPRATSVAPALAGARVHAVTQAAHATEAPNKKVTVKPSRAAPIAAPAPTVEKSAPKTERERLDAAIGESMLSTPSKKSGKKASAASEYDPLNPNL